MKYENAKKILLELALHRYDEEVHRNQLIDDKNKSIVAFLGVMLTIQCTILPRLIEFKEILSNFEMVMLMSIFIISFGFYLISLLVFMSVLNRLDQIQTAPDIKNLIDLDYHNASSKYIVAYTLINLNQCIDDNDEILEKKTSRRHLGFQLMKCGVISPAILIMYVVSII